MQKVLFDGQQISVDEIGKSETSWGYTYRLYKDGRGRYFATLADGMPDVIELCTAERMVREVTDDMAGQAFRQYMQEIEESQEQE